MPADLMVVFGSAWQGDSRGLYRPSLATRNPEQDERLVFSKKRIDSGMGSGKGNLVTLVSICS
jgi:hypothetical protein